MKRRKFITQTATLAAAPFVLTQKGEAAKGPANERVRVGMVGASGRAGSLNRIFARNKDVEIVGIAEIDPRRLPGTLESVTKTQGQQAQDVYRFQKTGGGSHHRCLVCGHARSLARDSLHYGLPLRQGYLRGEA